MTNPDVRTWPAGSPRVGLQRENYPERRNISGSSSGAVYRPAPVPDPRVARLQRGIRRGLDSLRGRSGKSTDREFTFQPRGPMDVDLFHVFNSIVVGRHPWVSTFETIVPRFASTLRCHHGPTPGFSALGTDGDVRSAVAHLAHPSCLALLALSQCNLRMQEELLDLFPDQRDAVLPKLQHLPPPQPMLVRGTDKKAWDTNEEIRFVFIGAAFFRKGGRETLRVLERMQRLDSRIRLTVVSRLRPDPYVGRVDRDEIDRTVSTLERMSSWAQYHPSLDNEQVLALMRRSHVGLLPTYADTYGYTVLEFQAAGCPVITTDVRALPELNDESSGWVIEVPRNRFGEALFTSEEDRLELSSSIEDGLERAVRGILDDPDSIRPKAERCLERIARTHDPEKHGRELARIYARVL